VENACEYGFENRMGRMVVYNALQTIQNSLEIQYNILQTMLNGLGYVVSDTFMDPRVGLVEALNFGHGDTVQDLNTDMRTLHVEVVISN